MKLNAQISSKYVFVVTSHWRGVCTYFSNDISRMTTFRIWNKLTQIKIFLEFTVMMIALTIVELSEWLVSTENDQHWRTAEQTLSIKSQPDGYLPPTWWSCLNYELGWTISIILINNWYWCIYWYINWIYDLKLFCHLTRK